MLESKITAGDMYASAASASALGRPELAAEIEKIGDEIAAGQVVAGFVWECPTCHYAEIAKSASSAADQYVLHLNGAHR